MDVVLPGQAVTINLFINASRSFTIKMSKPVTALSGGGFDDSASLFMALDSSEIIKRHTGFFLAMVLSHNV